MLFEGNSEVLARLHEKKRLLAEGNPRHEEIRPALLVCSGVMRGTYGVGQLLALHHAKLNHVFDVAVGVSTGAPAIAYLLAEQERPSIYWKEAASKEFISLSRFLLGKGPVMDTDYICRVFEEINQNAVRSSRTRFYIGATCARTGESLFLDTRDPRFDLVELIRASIAFPGVAKGEVRLGDAACLDGSGTMTFPAEQVLRKFDPTDLLVLANHPDGTRKGVALEALLVMKYPQQVQRAYAQRHKQAELELAYLRMQIKCRWGVIWTDDEVGRFERDQNKLEAAAMRSYQHLKTLLAEVSAPALTS